MGEALSNTAQLELAFPDQVEQLVSDSLTFLIPLSWLQQPQSSSRTSLWMNIPEMTQELFLRLARQVWGVKDIPPPGKDCLSAPSALPVGKYLKDLAKGWVWSYYNLNHHDSEPFLQDHRLLSQRSSFPTSANITFKC